MQVAGRSNPGSGIRLQRWVTCAFVLLAAVRNAPAEGLYLILYGPGLQPAAEAWATYRAQAGWTVTTMPAPDDEDSATRRDKARASIRAHARAAIAAPGELPRCMVLILGDSDEPGGVPTWYRPQPDPSLRVGAELTYATDEPYQCLDDGDQAPDLPLGRVPARSIDDALAVLDKIKRYEQREHDGAWQRRLAYVAGEGRFGPADLILEALFRQMVDRTVPPLFDISMTYGKATSIYCPPPGELTATILGELARPSLVFTYVGHGHARGLDALRWGGKQLPMLRAADLATLEAPSPEAVGRPIALLTCCSAGWFDLPGASPCVAEAMLLHPGGPIAVIAGSRPTHPYANVIHQHHLTHLLLEERVATIGEADLLAARRLLTVDPETAAISAIAAPFAAMMQWASTLAELRVMHAGLYNLLGDPALRIAHPARGLTDLRLEGRAVTGRAPGMASGRASVSIETLPGDQAQPASLIPVTDRNDPDLESKAKRNYALANDRLLARREGEVSGGLFRVQLEDLLPSGGAIIKVMATGTDERGGAVESAGAIRVEPTSSHP